MKACKEMQVQNTVLEHILHDLGADAVARLNHTDQEVAKHAEAGCQSSALQRLGAITL